MTQFIEPNKKSDLVAPRVFDWLKCLRTGLLEGFTVTPGSSGLLITIASGRVIIGGTTVYDDLTRNDSTLISSAPGTGNRHFLVYAKYTYVDTFPPAAMEIKVAVNSAVAPLKPTAPALPPDSVKLADIFLPEGDTDWTDALFVNAPKMPDRGQADADVLIERLIASNNNVVCAGGGSIIYDGGGNITWSQDIKFFATTTTHQEKYFTVPLAVGQIPQTASPLTGVTDNCIVFTVLDRTTVGDPAAPGTLPLYVLDLNTPDDTIWDIFFDPANRDDIFWLAMVIDGELVTRAGVGNALPPPDADGEMFLRNDPGGDHYWSLLNGGVVKSDYVKGGLHEYEWSSGTYADVYAALNALITSERRNKGMVVRMLRTGDTTWGTYTWDGSAWQPMADVAATYGHGIITGFTVGLVGGGASVGVGPGILVDWAGQVQIKANSETGIVPTGPGTWTIYYNTSTHAIGTQNHETSAVGFSHMPLAVGTHNGTIWTGLQQCQKYANGVKSDHFVTVGSDKGLYYANFTTVRTALMWMSCFSQSWGKAPREIRVISDISEVAQDHIFGCISFDSDDLSGEYDPYLTGTVDMFTGLRIIGYTDGTDQTHPHPIVTFTQGGYYGYFIDFNFTKHVYIEGLAFKYTGGEDHYDNRICALLNLGPGSHVVDCEMIEASAPLTAFASWFSTGPINFGGYDEDQELNGTTFERVRVDSVTPENIFYAYSDDEITGRLNLINCSFSGAAADYLSLVNVYDMTWSGWKTSVVVSDCFIANCGDRVFYGAAYTKFQISNCLFGTLASGCADIDAGNNDTHVVNCIYETLAPLTLGAIYYTNCRFMTDATVDNQRAYFSNCSNHDQPFGLVSGLAWVQRFSGTSFPRSQVLYGCELGPDTLLDTSYYAAGRVEPGLILMPNGVVAKITSAITYSIKSSGGQRQNIGNTAWTDPAGTATPEHSFYWFVRYTGSGSPVLRFDTSPPDVYGRPSSTPAGAESTYSKNDYAFVGTLDVFNSTVTAGSAAAGLYLSFRGGAYVQNLGGGLRRFGTASSHMQSSAVYVSGNIFFASGSGSIVVFDQSAWAQYAHAMGFNWTLNARINNAGGLSADCFMTTGGVAWHQLVASGDDEFADFNIETPIAGTTQDVEARLDAQTGTNITFYVDAVIHSITENVNRLSIRQQGVDM
jgi:hypothetical protein